MREIKFRTLIRGEWNYWWPQALPHVLEAIEYHKAPTVQYTGLKDKNGVEIYEGDIVKLSEFGDELPENLEVKWATNGYHLYAKDPVGWRSSLAWHDDKFDIEVIGNIYENPELLTQGNDLADEGRKPN